MEHYPEDFGFLFRSNANTERAITQAVTKYGKNETLRVIQNAIPPIGKYPVLHKIFSYTPTLVEDFLVRYPGAIYLKDKYSRHLLHVTVKSDVKTSCSCLLMMLNSNKDFIEVKDLVTNLYPFMLAAAKSGRKEKDLNTIYKLLSLRSGVISE